MEDADHLVRIETVIAEGKLRDPLQLRGVASELGEAGHGTATRDSDGSGCVRFGQSSQQAVRIARFAVRLAVAPALSVLAFYDRLKPASLAVLHHHPRPRTGD